MLQRLFGWSAVTVMLGICGFIVAVSLATWMGNDLNPAVVRYPGVAALVISGSGGILCLLLLPILLVARVDPLEPSTNEGISAGHVGLGWVVLGTVAYTTVVKLMTLPGDAVLGVQAGIAVLFLVGLIISLYAIVKGEGKTAGTVGVVMGLCYLVVLFATGW